jgi:hypothetical protein
MTKMGAEGSWSNQLTNLIILSAAQSGFSGFFVYSPSPGPGNLIGSWAAVAGVDQYGNAYPAGLSVDVGSLTGVSLFVYSGTPAAGNLIATVTAAAGVDGFGNHYLANISSYGAAAATSLAGGFVTFYSGSLAGGWTGAATLTLGAGVLFLTAAAGINLADAATAGSSLDVMGVLTAGAGLGVTGGTTTDTLTVTGNGQVDGTLGVSGALTTNGLLTATNGFTLGGNMNANTSTINIANGNVDLNMASPPNYPTSGKTLAQTQACLDGLIGSMINRQLVA